MITIRTFDNAIEDHLLRSRLEHEGIPAYIFDEHIVTLNPLYSNLVGGIKVRVSSQDEERAVTMLDRIDQLPLADDSGKEIVCPRCGSRSFYTGFRSMKSVRGVVAFVISLLFIVWPLYYKSVKKCRGCGLEV